MNIGLMIAIVAYLTAGLYFKTNGFSWYQKLILWVLWLPITLTLLLIYSSGGKK